MCCTRMRKSSSVTMHNVGSLHRPPSQVPRQDAVHAGRALISRMKDLLDRQQFEVVLQVRPS